MTINTAQRFISKINNIKFDRFIIGIAIECINYIRNAEIRKLNNKIDGSVLSESDLKVDEIVRSKLMQIDPKIKVLSEEFEFSLNSFLDECYWIIDPIDGTRSYVMGNDEYTINIALIYNGTPYLGLIAHPPSNKIWYSINNRLLIFENGVKRKHKDKINEQKKIVITSNENNEEINSFLKKIKNYKRFKVSSSLKFCYLAEKRADFYPRFSVINKWDIAAGHSILNATGGVLVNLEGKEIKYNSKSLKTEKFIAFSSKSIMREFF